MDHGFRVVGTLSNSHGNPVVFNATGLVMPRVDGDKDFILPIDEMSVMEGFEDGKATLAVYEPEGCGDIFELSLRQITLDDQKQLWAIWKQEQVA